MHAGGGAGSERCAFEGSAHALLVERVASLMDGREQRLADIVLVNPGGDAHVTGGEFCAERMMGLVEPAAVEVVADLFDHGEAEIKLRALAKEAAQTPIVGRRLLGYGAHDRH